MTVSRRLAEAGVLLAVAASVLYWSPLSTSPIDQDRGTVVIVLAVIVAAAKLPWSRPRGFPLIGYAVVAVLASLALSTALSENLHLSLVSNGRGEGAIFQCAIILLAASATFHVERFRWLLTGLTVFLVLYAVLQVSGHDPVGWQIPDRIPGGPLTVPASEARPFATMGNPDFLASWLIMAAPLLGMPGLLLAVVGVVATQARGALIAIAGAYLIYLGLRFRWLYAGLLLLAFGGGWLLLHVETGQTRLALWRAYVPVLGWSPVSGIGPEMTVEVDCRAASHLPYCRELSQQLVAYEGPGVWDRLHDAVLDIGLEQGAVGLASMGSLIAVVGYMGWKTRKQPFALSCSLGLLAHLIDGLGSPQPVATELLAWLYVAAITTVFVAMVQKRDSETENSDPLTRSKADTIARDM